MNSDNRRHPRVLVADASSRPETRQMALAVSDKLDGYYSAFCLRAAGQLTCAPGVGAIFRRRVVPSPLAPVARSLAAPFELGRVAATRLQLVALSRWLMWARNETFDRRVARLSTPGAILIGQVGASARAFANTRAHGGKNILNYPIARFEFVKQILDEEAALSPEFVGPQQQLPTARDLERIRLEVQLADAIVVGSAFAGATFKGTVPAERVKVIPYGVDAEVFELGAESAPASDAPFRVLFAGHVSQRKGIAYLLQALDMLDPQRFELTVVGNVLGWSRGLEKYRGRFRLLQGVSPIQMPAIYRAADVLVLPSLVEGSALVVLEAMASGLPVVVTPNVGAEAVTDGREGFVVPIRSARAIAERLESLAMSAELRATMGKQARRSALLYDWPRFRQHFRAVLETLGA